MAGFRLGAFSFLFAVIGTVRSAALTFDSIVNKPNSVLTLGGVLCIVCLSGCSTIPEMPNAISCSGGTRVVSGFEKCVYLPRESEGISAAVTWGFVALGHPAEGFLYQQR